MSFLLLKRTVFHSCQIKGKNQRKFTIESAKLSCAQWRTRHVAAPATRRGPALLCLSCRCTCGPYARFSDATPSLEPMAFPVEQN